ncbi:glutamate--ammonia ligase [Mycolicibacterium mageritense DSM 44476 = CIP 104973]|uniref:Glutamine synthetase n=1 Tax=Mycolicibacterium mageritense TaxID=53462 RepID=A0ABM7HVJ3_MYCME|nr:glutamine synthetase [Mycolicibacterium mageritense]MCC9181572.1 glutamine synthetase [Mycolicibacterium mageritense]BBX34612.1 glutamine synthetase [Mycolicibacterium mageritense]CDO20869.1 glutamine synthetase catalytic domain-containing protein [Mycolicibacterium mageritense DSM 44476 = CIP 104973]
MSELTLPRMATKAIRVEATNHDGSFMGKNVTPAKFASGKDSGFAFADILFAIDMGTDFVFGDAFPDWRGNLYDIALVPDMSTLVEWKPGMDSVIGDFWMRDGRPLPICPRNMVRRLADRLSALGYSATVAVEIETTLFEESIQEARARGYRDLTPLGGDTGSAYNLARSKDWIDYMEAVTDRLDSLGITWEAWTDEAAPGQTELNIAPADPVALADAWVRTKQVMREVAYEQGRSVTFMAKPTAGFGQGAHVNLSLQRDGVNQFFCPDGPSEVMLQAIGGLMATMAGNALLAMPQITSYRRLVDISGPPTTMSWGVNNKTAALRAIVGHPKYSRLEYRVPGSDVNPYYALAGVLAGVLAGLERGLTAPPPCDDMAWSLPDDTGVARIPDTMTKAIAALDADPLLREYLGDEFVEFWVASRRWEWMQFHTKGGDPYTELSAWESHRYFEFT